MCVTLATSHFRLTLPVTFPEGDAHLTHLPLTFHGSSLHPHAAIRHPTHPDYKSAYLSTFPCPLPHHTTPVTHSFVTLSPRNSDRLWAHHCPSHHASAHLTAHSDTSRSSPLSSHHRVPLARTDALTAARSCAAPARLSAPPTAPPVIRLLTDPSGLCFPRPTSVRGCSWPTPVAQPAPSSSPHLPRALPTSFSLSTPPSCSPLSPSPSLPSPSPSRSPSPSPSGDLPVTIRHRHRHPRHHGSRGVVPHEAGPTRP